MTAVRFRSRSNLSAIVMGMVFVLCHGWGSAASAADVEAIAFPKIGGVPSDIRALPFPAFPEAVPRIWTTPFHQVAAFDAASPLSTSLSPALVRRAYGFDQIPNQGQGQLIAIVTAFDHPRIQADLKVFNNAFGLRRCTTANGCFNKVYASGVKPEVSRDWAVETALDVEWAHAIAPKAKILLVEAASNYASDLLTAINVAVQQGASVVSMSWGWEEIPNEALYLDRFFFRKNKNVSFVAAAGNFGGDAIFYPAASPYVLGTGGTSLTLAIDGSYMAETAWSYSSGGLSLYEGAPVYQQSYPIPYNPELRRGVPDVGYDADPAVGFAVFTSVSPFGRAWLQVGGTSAGAPQWAGLLAITNSLRKQAGKKPFGERSGITVQAAIYWAAGQATYAHDFHDVTSGSNGPCDLYCQASIGYDYVTGLGTPVANHLVAALVAR